MAERALSDFEHTLVGLVARSPSSTYDLKKLFADTPASVYRPSAGTLVPALRRLELWGYLHVREDLGARHQRRIYSATTKGRAAQLAWLREPVEPESVGRDLGVHLMRFVLMESKLSRGEVRRFLAELADALEGFVARIEDDMATTSCSGQHRVLALRHSVAVHRASLEWARATMELIDRGTGEGGVCGQVPANRRRR